MSGDWEGRRHIVTNRCLAALVVSGSLVVLSLSGAAQQAPPPTETVVPDQLKSFVPVTNEMLLRPKPENWLSFRNGYKLWGYSSLDQIDADNVDQLRLVWSRAMQHGYQETEPIVYNGVMFLSNVEDIVQAVDATTGDLLWEYRRNLPDNVATITGTRYRYRNVSIYGDKVFLATNDAFLVALDARTGEVLWETQRADYLETGVAQTNGPLVVNGKLLTGSRCSSPNSPPGGCFITANDIETGEELWRVNTAATPDQPGGDTWAGVPLSLRIRASPWMVGSYDPDQNLVFWGTGPLQPLPKELRGVPDTVDLLYTNSTLALNPDTGEMAWYFQHLPRDNWDLDHVFERMIVETRVAPNPDEVPWISANVRSGETRKVLTGIPGKTGVVWTLDAETGQFLWARPTVYQNVMTGIDVETGRVQVADWDIMPSCPHLFGGKNQPSGAYSPDTNAMYMPMNESCQSGGYGTAAPGQSGMRMRHIPGADPETATVGRLEAVSASTGETLWSHRQRAPYYGSALATGGNLVFAGDIVRRFRAHDAQTGAVLWQTILNGPVGGRPMTYSVNGRQYLAIGAGGLAMGTAFLRLTPELTTPTGSNTLFVFALPES